MAETRNKVNIRKRNVLIKKALNRKSKKEKDEMVGKARLTKEKRYGDPNYNNRSKIRKTSLEKYGHLHWLQNEKLMNEKCMLYIDGRSKEEWYSGVNFRSKIVRLRLLENQNHTCPICGTKDPKRFELHHIDGNRYNDDPLNFIFLCSHCHPKTKFNQKEYLETSLSLYRKEIIGDIEYGYCS